MADKCRDCRNYNRRDGVCEYTGRAVSGDSDPDRECRGNGFVES